MNTDVIRLQRKIGIGGALTMIGLLATGLPIHLTRIPDRTALTFLATATAQQFILLLVVFTATAIITNNTTRVVQVVVIFSLGLVGQVSDSAGTLTGLTVAGIALVLGAQYGLFQRQASLRIALIAGAMLLSMLAQVIRMGQDEPSRWLSLDFSYRLIGAAGLFAAYIIAIRNVAMSEANRRVALEQEVANRTAELRAEVERRREAESRESAAAERARQLAGERLELLGEVHHRARNSLQMVLSLLESFDPQSPEGTAPTINRVRAIGLVYDLVDAGKDLSSIVLEDYLERLIWHLQMSHADRTLQIAYDRADYAHTTQLEPTISLGLLIHELVAMTILPAVGPALSAVSICQSDSDSSIDFEIGHRTNGFSDHGAPQPRQGPSGLLGALMERLHIKPTDCGKDGVWKLSIPKEVLIR